ncbi:MAG: PEP-CTERM sorting domain-containing protein [Opitutaceae bacterium]|jgi:hypothetical protein|nr:PEP-CTERM sorting domain-containing protein [Opitutaceae bacterium]
MKTHRILILLTGLLTCAASVWAIPPEIDLLSNSWYRTSALGARFSKSTTAITYRPNNESSEALSYFATQSSPVTLAVGEMLTLSFDYKLDIVPTSRGNALRIGVFSSGDETRASADFTSAGANNYTGYFITTNPGATGSTGTALRARTDANTGSTYLIGGASGSPPGDALNTSASFKVTANTTYSGFLTIARIDEDAVKITWSSGGASGTWTDPVFNYTSFDTIGLSFGRISTGTDVTLTMSNLKLKIATIPVPEPATVALLGGLGCLLAVVFKRHSNRQTPSLPDTSSHHCPDEITRLPPSVISPPGGPASRPRLRYRFTFGDV